jgi:hypothetical protein
MSQPILKVTFDRYLDWGVLRPRLQDALPVLIDKLRTPDLVALLVVECPEALARLDEYLKEEETRDRCPYWDLLEIEPALKERVLWCVSLSDRRAMAAVNQDEADAFRHWTRLHGPNALGGIPMTTFLVKNARPTVRAYLDWYAQYRIEAITQFCAPWPQWWLGSTSTALTAGRLHAMAQCDLNICLDVLGWSSMTYKRRRYV